MWCKKCGKKCGKSSCLCPISFGLALGVTSGLAVLLWSLWIMYNGIPAMMADQGLQMTWGMAFMHAFWALIKGFIFGLVFALIYDLFACFCRAKCCKGDGCNCDHGSKSR